MSDVTAEPFADETVVETDGAVLVGVGSSAGGLEAIREFVRALPADINASFIVAQHMAPKYRSHMVPLVASETELVVADVVDGLEPAPGHVYITPPNHDVTFDGRTLLLHDPNALAGAPKPSVDRLLISLAENAQARSIGIILSGTGTDGAYGIQAIRERGGITIAQDDGSAKYDGMPNAAIETGCTDLILSPREIGSHLSRILESRDHMKELRAEDHESDAISEILQIVSMRTSVDFREYKSTTIHRRIERRMLALDVPTKEEYTEICRSTPREVDTLYKDLLISVTNFFRDKEEFRRVGRVIQRIVDDAMGDPIRIWTAGCATGEETYSIAILVAEALGGAESLKNHNVQIFATDLDEKALTLAREGRYRAAAQQDIPQEFAEKYFAIKGEFIEVDHRLRNLVLFTKHNICSDPPFLKLDLVVCRNLLIYLRPKMQNKVFSRLNYALNEDGMLFLGKSESVSVANDLFVPIERQGHIFKKHALSRQSTGRTASALLASAPPGPITPLGRPRALKKTAQDALLRQITSLEAAIAPMSLRVSLDHKVLKVHGNWTDYIEISDGAMTQLSTRMLIPPLDQEAFSLVTLASKHGERRRGIVHRGVGRDGENHQFGAYPVTSSEDDPYVLLTMETWTPEPSSRTPPQQLDPGQGGDSGEVILSLQSELDSTRETLQQVIEELETSNEELQTLNEELQSANEELQATNEELETANEELQSTNEELITVNEELNVNTDELQNVNAEMESVFSHLGAALIVVDAALQLRRVNDDGTALLGWNETLFGTHLSQMPYPPGFPNINEICAQATLTGTPSRTIIDIDGRDHSMICTPFYSRTKRVIGCSMLITVVSD
ncbi:MAG: chemotaxis protein CheB [Pseudomonadota bacterium]